jgi:hypothetical protein
LLNWFSHQFLPSLQNSYPKLSYCFHESLAGRHVIQTVPLATGSRQLRNIVEYILFPWVAHRFPRICDPQSSMFWEWRLVEETAQSSSSSSYQYRRPRRWDRIRTRSLNPPDPACTIRQVWWVSWKCCARSHEKAILLEWSSVASILPFHPAASYHGSWQLQLY